MEKIPLVELRLKSAVINGPILCGSVDNLTEGIHIDCCQGVCKFLNSSLLESGTSYSLYTFQLCKLMTSDGQ